MRHWPSSLLCAVRQRPSRPFAVTREYPAPPFDITRDHCQIYPARLFLCLTAGPRATCHRKQQILALRNRPL